MTIPPLYASGYYNPYSYRNVKTDFFTYTAAWLLFTANLPLTGLSGYKAVNSNIRRLMRIICLADWSLLTPESAWQLPEQQCVQAAVNSSTAWLEPAHPWISLAAAWTAGCSGSCE